MSNASSPSPVRELLGDRNFRNYWLAQVVFSGINGTIRFAFIWLIVTLTDWPSAEGLIGIALGIPALLLSLPAGAWSDRVDRRRFHLLWTSVSAGLLVVFAVVVAAGGATPLVAGAAAVLLGGSLAVAMPNLSAIVPLLVPKERLMNAAALQNGGSQAASFAGLTIGGLAIGWFGNAAGFAMLAGLCALSVALMSRVRLNAQASTPADGSKPKGDGPSSGADQPSPRSLKGLGAEMKAGARYGLGREPLRTLLILSLILGSSFSVMQIALPRVVDETFERGSGSAGLLLGTFGIGMMISSAAVAGRSGMKHARNVCLFIGVGLGMGQFLLSLAPTYEVAMVVMLAWGINAGIAIASHRTLLQGQTEPAMMGRVMGLMTLGFAGGLPFGALAQSVLAPALGPIVTMRTVGLVTMCITIPLTWRPGFRRL